MDGSLGGMQQYIQVLKPVSAKDALYVEFEPNTISIVLLFLREAGFAPESAAKKVQHDGEKGIQRRKDGKFLVKKQLGKHKSQIVPTLWDALQLQQAESVGGEPDAAEDPPHHGIKDPPMEKTANVADTVMDMQNEGNEDGIEAGDPPDGNAEDLPHGLLRSMASEDLQAE